MPRGDDHRRRGGRRQPDYAVQGGTGSVSSVSGTWTVPSTLSGSGYTSEWVGIDGFQRSTVEQLGTEANVSGGQTTYYAWYEMYPSDPVTISSITVHPGDIRRQPQLPVDMNVIVIPTTP